MQVMQFPAHTAHSPYTGEQAKRQAMPGIGDIYYSTARGRYVVIQSSIFEEEYGSYVVDGDGYEYDRDVDGAQYAMIVHHSVTESGYQPLCTVEQFVSGEEPDSWCKVEANDEFHNEAIVRMVVSAEEAMLEEVFIKL